LAEISRLLVRLNKRVSMFGINGRKDLNPSK